MKGKHSASTSVQKGNERIGDPLSPMSVYDTTHRYDTGKLLLVPEWDWTIEDDHGHVLLSHRNKSIWPPMPSSMQLKSSRRDRNTAARAIPPAPSNNNIIKSLVIEAGLAHTTKIPVGPARQQPLQEIIDVSYLAMCVMG